MTLFTERNWILKRSAQCFFIFLVAGFVLLTLAYAVPNDWILENGETSIAMVKEEYRNDPAREWSGMFNNPANTINYGCDRKFIQRALIEDSSLNAMEAAMSVNNYARYWHGYQVFVRPMLAVGTYENMVYVSVLVFFLLMIYCFIKLRERLGTAFALAFFFTLYAVRIMATSLCLNNSGCFIVAMALMLAVLKLSNTPNEKWLYPLFLLAGMVVNYIDVLTAPMVSLCLPLAVHLSILLSEGREDLKENLTDTVALPVFWAVGWGLFWACKWLIGSLVLGRNLITDAVEQAGIRIAGEAAYDTSPLGAITANLAVIFPDDRLTQVLVLVIVLALAVLLLLYHKNWKTLWRGLPLFIVALSPFLWMAVLSNHSQIHAPFVFRILSVSIFASLCFVIHGVDKTKLPGGKRGKKDL